MSAFHDLAQRATAKLHRDRELRLEVSHELETHLEASAAEFRAADYSEDDAHAAAVRAFGDPDAVAEALWDANRFRLKLRAWAWWAARLTLLPACVVATLIFIVSGLTTTTRLNEVTSGVGPTEPSLLLWHEKRLKSRMTAEQRLIYFGDESAADPIARWRAVRDAHPDQVLDQLELISVMLAQLPKDPAKNPEAFRTQRDALLLELERGAAMDPDNGVYASIAAGVWARMIELDDQHPEAFAVVRTLERKANSQERTDFEINRILIEGQESALAETLEWIAIAASKPHISIHTSDRVRRRLAQLPAPGSMQEYVMRVAGEVSTLLPSLGLSRNSARVLGAEAIRRAEAGDGAGAHRLLDELDAVNAKLAASADTLISLLVAISLESYTRATRVAVWQALGDEAQAAVALKRSDALVHAWQTYWCEDLPEERSEDEKLQTSGFLMSTLIPAVPGYRVDTTPFCQAEYTLMDRGVLTGGLLVLVSLSALASLMTTLTIWRGCKSDEAPVLLWIGWRRLGAVIGGAVGLPVLGFVVWSGTPWSGRGFGLNYSLAALVWYLPLVFGVLLLIWRTGTPAAYSKAREIGMSIPKRRGWARDAAMAGALVVVAFTLWNSISWTDRWADIDSFGWSVANLVAILLVLAVAWVWSALEVAWVRGVSRPWPSLVRGLVVGVAVTAGLGGVFVLVVWFGMDRVDWWGMFLFVMCVAALVGALSGLFWLAGRTGETVLFARSVVRSMAWVWAVVGLTLAITVGWGLNLRERALATRMVEMSPVLFDQEIEQSNAREMRAYLAGDQPRPPRLP